MASEQIKFKLTLSGTYWDKAPQFRIIVDDTVVEDSVITANSGVDQVFEFELPLDEDSEHSLKIQLHGKTWQDTVENADKTAIIKDMLLNIEKVEIDDINLNALKWTHSKYHIDDTNETTSNTVNLGQNGTWELKFTLPFYIWLLENT